MQINYKDCLLKQTKEFFRINLLNVGEETICDIVEQISKTFVPEKLYNDYEVFVFLFEKLEPLNPDILFYPDFYRLEGIPEVCTYILWYRIKQTKTIVNKRLFHELAYQAHMEHERWLFLNIGNVKDYFHAINKVLKPMHDG